jgi:hypothetical protein
MTLADSILVLSVFPIQAAAIPQLYAYQVLPSEPAAIAAGGKFAFRVQQELGGHWTFTDQRLVTDQSRPVGAVIALLHRLWTEAPDLFRDVRFIQADPTWTPTPLSLAHFMARAIFPAQESAAITAILTKAEPPRLIGQGVQVRLVLNVYGRVFAGAPCLDLNLKTELCSTESLPALARRLGRMDDLTALLAEDITGGHQGLRGRIGRITVGLNDDTRDYLYRVSARAVMKQHIRQAPATDWVVSLTSRGKTLDYVASALRVIVQPDDYRRLGLDPQVVRQATILAPDRRGKLMTIMGTHLQQRGLIGKAVSSRTHRALFLTPAEVGYPPKIRVGSGQVVAFVPYRADALANALRQYGCYRVGTQPLRLAVLNAVAPRAGEGFLRQLIEGLSAFGVGADLIGLADPGILTRASQEAALAALQRESPHLIVGLFPDAVGRDRVNHGHYDDFKQLTVGRGTGSQVLYAHTISQRYALLNVALQVLTKTGTITRVLAKPLPGVDVVVGLDIARRLKRDRAGTMNIAVCTHVYAASGEPIWYGVEMARQDGETIPASVLQQMLPAAACRGRRVLILRDGPYRRGEAHRLQSWAQEIGATFALVAVIKESPRVLTYQRQAFIQAETGTTALPDGLPGTEAIVVSSLPPDPKTTAQPLLIRSYAPYPILDAVHSVLSLTALHGGSARPPRQPMPLHAVQRIGQLALKGILPSSLSGETAYWV